MRKIEEPYGFSTPEQNMIRRQAEIISHNNDVIRQLHERVNQVETEKLSYQNDALMWRKVAKMVGENEQLQGIWDDLVVTMKLIDEQNTFKEAKMDGYYGAAKA